MSFRSKKLFLLFECKNILLWKCREMFKTHEEDGWNFSKAGRRYLSSYHIDIVHILSESRVRFSFSPSMGILVLLPFRDVRRKSLFAQRRTTQKLEGSAILVRVFESSWSELDKGFAQRLQN